ncbi:hypothetical protein [Thermodesulfovibrio thiophilus]|uniref:hypothetical protein n=1 Tax=Thermodesulfovibrio thiophilus TaxID=340095 RepID=UPI0004043196|nr:hypothetical protein [Thermodesulfovibrio thiophilus]
MKIYIEKDSSVWINGKEIKVAPGSQEVDDEVGRILIDAGYAKAIDEEKRKNK